MQPDTSTPHARREAEIRAMIVSTLRKASPLLGDRRVVLFGSRAAGKARPRSDFDLGVIGSEPLPLRNFYAIEDMLEALPTLYHIDWVDLTRADARFRVRALDKAETLHG